MVFGIGRYCFLSSMLCVFLMLVILNIYIFVMVIVEGVVINIEKKFKVILFFILVCSCDGIRFKGICGSSLKGVMVVVW